MAGAIELAPPLPTPRERPREATTEPDHGKIQCPRCHWKPGPDDVWSCTCGHSWNTFDTHGRCPSCGKQWMETQCPHCGEWSPHEAWYVDDTASFPA